MNFRILAAAAVLFLGCSPAPLDAAEKKPAPRIVSTLDFKEHGETFRVQSQCDGPNLVYFVAGNLGGYTSGETPSIAIAEDDLRCPER